MTSATQKSACANPEKTNEIRALAFSYAVPVAEKCLLPCMQDFVKMTTEYPGGDVPEEVLTKVRQSLLNGMLELREEAGSAMELAFNLSDGGKPECRWESHAATYALVAVAAARSAIEACMPELDDGAVKTSNWALMSTKEGIMKSPKIREHLTKNPSAFRQFSLWCLSKVVEKTTSEAVLACAKLMVTHPDGHIPSETLQMHAQSLQQAHRESDRSARQAWRNLHKAKINGKGDATHLKQLAISASIQEGIVKVASGACDLSAWEGAEMSAYWMRFCLDDDYGTKKVEIQQQQNEALEAFLEAL